MGQIIKNKLVDGEVTRKMLHVIRESAEKEVGATNLIKEEKEPSKKEKFVIKKNTPQFGTLRTSQEEALFKAVGERVNLEDDALVYYSKDDKLVLTGKIGGLGLAFQFVYNDPSNDGCYIWANEFQLTDSNERVIGKMRDAFLNWKSTIDKDGDLFQKLKKEIEK